MDRNRIELVRAGRRVRRMLKPPAHFFQHGSAPSKPDVPHEIVFSASVRSPKHFHGIQIDRHDNRTFGHLSRLVEQFL